MVTTMGKKAPRKIRKTAARSPTPKKMIATGIQAIGLIGRRICRTGFTTWFAAGYQPSVKPEWNSENCSGAKSNRDPAQRIADVTPEKTLPRSIQQCPFSTASGEGKTLVAVQTTE